MQSFIDMTIRAGAILSCLLISELMIQRLKHGAMKIRNTYKEVSETTLSFRFFMKHDGFWYLTYILLWLFAGALFSSLLFGDSNNTIFPILLFYLVGELRRGRVWKYAESTRVQRRWTKQWGEIKLYRKLIDTKNNTLMRILETPGKLDELVRVARNAKLVATFDPDRMEDVTRREMLTQRLLRYLHFLMSESANKRYTLEEIYVVLFILSTESDTLGEVANNLLSSDLSSEFRDQKDVNTPDET